MIKYRITQNGINELIIQEAMGGNTCCLTEKVLSVLDKTVWQAPIAVFQSIKNDKTLKTNDLTLGAISSMLIDFRDKGYVIEYNEPIDKPMGGDLSAYSI